jgi:ribosomal-protein-alanine N-acetyltransferase
VVRRTATHDDRAAIAAIQLASPEASGWDPYDYDVTVAEHDGSIVGFLVTRHVASDEIEILNLAVAPSSRRKGVARALLLPLLESLSASVFLEVRESNCAARQFYASLGFKELNRRPGYYANPPEAGIVMKFHSC